MAEHTDDHPRDEGRDQPTADLLDGVPWDYDPRTDASPLQPVHRYFDRFPWDAGMDDG